MNSLLARGFLLLMKTCIWYICSTTLLLHFKGLYIKAILCSNPCISVFHEWCSVPGCNVYVYMCDEHFQYLHMRPWKGTATSRQGLNIHDLASICFNATLLSFCLSTTLSLFSDFCWHELSSGHVFLWRHSIHFLASPPCVVKYKLVPETSPFPVGVPLTTGWPLRASQVWRFSKVSWSNG